MGGCGLDSFPTPRPFWSLCTLSGPAPFPAPPLAIHCYSALAALYDLGSAPRSPAGAECSITNQRLRAGLRLFKSRPPPLILVVSVQQPQSHAARPGRCLLGLLAPLSISPGCFLFASGNLIFSPEPETLGPLLLGLQYPRVRDPSPGITDLGLLEPGIPDLLHLG